jgi:phosphate transport system substrate-binding protein
MDMKMIAIGLIVGLLVGLGTGYAVTQQPSASQGTELSGDVIVKGSDTLLIVAQRWAENFTAQHPKVRIQVAGGGSGVGFTALRDKTTHIADASREIKTSEVAACKANGANPVEWVVGIDGISIIVHPSNPITQLTLEQLEMIYNGSYTNWNQVGGNDATIITYGRQSTSGTYDFFREHVLHNKNFRADNRELAGNAEIVQSVQSDANGIGYVGVAYTKQGVSVKILKTKASSTATAYEPTIAHIKSGAYPIARKLYIYTDGIPTGVLEAYVSFILGPTGQRILEETGYIAYAMNEK